MSTNEKREALRLHFAKTYSDPAHINALLDEFAGPLEAPAPTAPTPRPSPRDFALDLDAAARQLAAHEAENRRAGFEAIGRAQVALAAKQALARERLAAIPPLKPNASPLDKVLRAQAVEKALADL